MTGLRSSSTISRWASASAPTRGISRFQRLEVDRRDTAETVEQRGDRSERTISAGVVAAERADRGPRRRRAARPRCRRRRRRATGPKTGSVAIPTSSSTLARPSAGRGRLPLESPARRGPRPSRPPRARPRSAPPRAGCGPRRARSCGGSPARAALSATGPPSSSAASPAACGPLASRRRVGQSRSRSSRAAARTPRRPATRAPAASASARTAAASSGAGRRSREAASWARSRQRDVAHDLAQGARRVLGVEVGRDRSAASRRAAWSAGDMKTAWTGSSRCSSARASLDRRGDVLGLGQQRPDEDHDQRVEPVPAAERDDRPPVLLGARRWRSCRPGCRATPRPGRKPRSSAPDLSGSCGTSSPAASQASAHMIPGPPALVRMPTRGPRRQRLGRRAARRRRASRPASRRGSRPTARRARRSRGPRPRAARRCGSWRRARRRAERPLLTTTIGFSRPIRLATREKRRGSLKDSM